jgi:hypothetical protein
MAQPRFTARPSAADSAPYFARIGGEQAQGDAHFDEQAHA